MIFAFGSFRPKHSIQRLLEALAAQLSSDFGLSVSVGSLGEGLQSDADLVLADVSRDLHKFHLSGLGKASRLFLISGGPSKVSVELQEFLQSLSSIHGKPVKWIYDRESHEDHVYQIDAALRETSTGYHVNSVDAPDVRALASALYQEYYTIRLHQLKRSRIEHIVQSLAEAATRQETAAGVAAESDASPASAGVHSAAARFLDGVLHSLDVPFAVKLVFFRYITFRLTTGQSLLDAVTELLPTVTEPDAFPKLFEQLRLELELHAMFGRGES